ncbi:MAG: hypothetical protein AAB211_04910 [Pseudomonadota bacterium]
MMSLMKGAIKNAIKINIQRHAALASLLVSSLWLQSAAADELAQVCWLADGKYLVRFSVTQTAPTRFTYTGIFNDGEDSAHYAITGAVEVTPAGPLVGSFSGSKSTAESFKTAIAAVNIDPATFAGSVELIRNKFTHGASPETAMKTDYKRFALVKTNCPS